MRRVIPEVLRFLAATDQRLQVSRDVVLAWEAILARFTDEQIQRAAVAVASRHHYGAPVAADIVIEIEGVERVVRARVRDLYNRYVLGANGDYQTESKTVRWFPDGREEPVKLPPHRDSGPLLGGGLGSIRDDLDGLLGEELEC